MFCIVLFWFFLLLHVCNICLFFPFFMFRYHQKNCAATLAKRAKADVDEARRVDESRSGKVVRCFLALQVRMSRPRIKYFPVRPSHPSSEKEVTEVISMYFFSSTPRVLTITSLTTIFFLSGRFSLSTSRNEKKNYLFSPGSYGNQFFVWKSLYLMILSQIFSSSALPIRRIKK